ncbi:MAG: hypothetical protein WBC36_14935 [Desulfobacterales bacterium]
MKKFRLVILIIFVSMIAISCVSGKVSYIAPQGLQSTNNSVVLKESKDKVWMKLIDGIGESFFVINNIEKDSGLINISYSDDPCRFISCGTLNSNVLNAQGKRKYNFPACIEYKEYEEFNKGNLFIIRRRITLDGRASIIVQKRNNGTLVKVNVRYVVIKDAKNYDPSWRFIRTELSSIIFNSNGGESFPNGMKCYANGQFEKMILDIVNK